MKEILGYFPFYIKEMLEKEILNEDDFLEEIRIRVKNPIVLKFSKKEKIINYLVTTEDILKILQAICENSIYSYQHQIAEGFVTIKGGHRVGISGSCVLENGNVININYINSLNFRIARQVIGASFEILKYILNIEKNNVKNTLIVSLPGAGKTTLLRDIARQISSGVKEYNFKALNVGIVDERGEIAALYKGIPQNDVGINVDVMDNIPKDIGMKMLVRSMAPQVIMADEIGTTEDVKAIDYVMRSGCKGIFSAHGECIEDLYLNDFIKQLIIGHVFEIIIFLDSKEKGNIKDVYIFDRNSMKYINYNKLKKREVS